MRRLASIRRSGTSRLGSLLPLTCLASFYRSRFSITRGESEQSIRTFSDGPAGGTAPRRLQAKGYATISDAYDVVAEFDPPPPPLPNKRDRSSEAALRAASAEAARQTPVKRSRSTMKRVKSDSADVSAGPEPLASTSGTISAPVHKEGHMDLQSGLAPTRTVWHHEDPPSKRKRTPKALDSSFDLVATQHAPPFLVKRAFTEQSAEEVRQYHRERMGRTTYLAKPKAESPTLGQPTLAQPHDKSLLSRYDWRLRAPSRSPSQKKAFEMRTTWRKKAICMPVADPQGDYKAYSARFLRFVSLERQATEDAALLRLMKGSSACGTSKPAEDGFDSAADHLSGLQATIKPPSSKHERQLGIFASSAKAKAARPDGGLQIDAELDWEGVQEDIEGVRRSTEEPIRVRFHRPQMADFPPNNFHKGDIVFVWKCLEDPVTGSFYVPALRDKTLNLEDLKQLPIKATVERVVPNRIDLAIPGSFPTTPETRYRLDIGYNDVSFVRMEEALRKLSFDAHDQRHTNMAASKGPHAKARNIEIQGTEIRDVVLEDFAASQTQAAEATDIGRKAKYDSVLMHDQWIASWAKRMSRPCPIIMDGDPVMGLNDTQVRSVAMAISDRISLIQGPPGTGKTATIVAILQLLKKHFAVPYPILVTSHTHVAVDLLTGKCAAAGLKPLRFGDRLRVGSDLDKHTYHAKIEKHRFQYRLQARSDQQARIEDQLSEIESRLRKPAEGTNIFDAGINGTESDQAETVKLTHEKEQLEKQLKVVRTAIIAIFKDMQSDLIESSDVCLSTCIGATAWEMQTADFPIVLIDEAGQCDEPTSLVPLMKGSQHLVLVGDHKQLPSVVTNPESSNENLNTSLFERLMLQGNVPSIQLDMQYRMLPQISEFSNINFYHDTIRDSPARQLAQQDKPSPVTFVNHSGPEKRVGQSLANETEADIVMDLVLYQHLEEKQDLKDIGLITGYAAQSELLKRRARETFGAQAKELEIHTVDGFQGREKSTIIMSMVRSNKVGALGFLTKEQRLNVALTRAQNRLLVVGNASTLAYVNPWASRDHIFQKYMAWLQKKGLIRNWKDRQTLVE